MRLIDQTVQNLPPTVDKATLCQIIIFSTTDPDTTPEEDKAWQVFVGDMVNAIFKEFGNPKTLLTPMAMSIVDRGFKAINEALTDGEAEHG